jgi:hypothetical protein
MSGSITETFIEHVAGVRNEGCAIISDTLSTHTNGGPGTDFASEISSVSSAPLHIAAPGMAWKRVGQSTSQPSAPLNLIVVTLVSNIALTQTAGSQVSITGLTGSATADNAAMSITDIACIPSVETCASNTFDAGVWTQASGTLVLQVATGQTMLAGRKYIFSFTLSNGAVAQASPAVSVHGSGSATFSQAMDKDTTSVLSAVGSIPGDAAPMYIRAASFIVRRMGQSTPYPNAANTLTLTFAANVVLSGGNIIRISGALPVVTTGLCGILGSAGCFVTLGGSAASMLHATAEDAATSTLANPSRASWDAIAQTLTMYISASTSVAAQTVHTLSIAVRNPSVPQQAPALAIAYLTAASGAIVASNTIQSEAGAPWSTSTTTTLTGDLTSDAVIVLVANAATAGITAGTMIQIDDEIMSVSRVQGTTTLAVTRGVSGSIAAAHASTYTTVARNSVSTTGYSTSTMPTLVRAVVYGSYLGDAAPLSVRKPEFLSSYAVQSTPYPGSVNTITVTFSVNVASPSGSASVYVSGMHGALARSGPGQVPLAGTHASMFTGELNGTATSTGYWEGGDAHAMEAFFFEAGMPAVEYSFSFNVVNPFTAQAAPYVSISLRAPSAYLNGDATGLTHTLLYRDAVASDNQLSVVDVQSLGASLAGVYIRMGSELMRIVTQRFTYVTSYVSDVATTVAVNDATAASITANTVIRMGVELLLVTSVSGNVLTVSRGFRETDMTEHLPFDIVHSGVVDVQRAVGGTTAQAHSGAASFVYTRVVCVTYGMSLSPISGKEYVRVVIGSYLTVDEEVMIVTSVDSDAQVSRCLFVARACL